MFSGEVAEADWNSHWEKLRYVTLIDYLYIHKNAYLKLLFFYFYREKYQKIRSPGKRSGDLYFDAGAKFHVPSDDQYIGYFIAHILEFQILRSLCLAAGEYQPNNPEKPLHKCDIQGSLIAGNQLKEGLKLGSSKHWKEVLKVITNEESELSAEAILDYFKPLHEFLKKENHKNRMFCFEIIFIDFRVLLFQ